MTREEAISALKKAQRKLDEEATHVEADEVLCSLLRSIGYHDVVDEWDLVPKWYA